MTDNQKREMVIAYFKMIIFCMVFYGALALCIISEKDPEKHIFIYFVAMGFGVSFVFLLVQIIKTLK